MPLAGKGYPKIRGRHFRNAQGMAEFAIRRIDELDPELVTVTVNPESERLRFQINSLDLNKTIDNPNYELECEDPKKMLQTKTV
jgi:hypothetical protein